MNNDLLINMYKLLKYYIKQNEEDLVTYNNMVANGDSYEERAEFCNKMKPVVDNFYALKPYYIKYRDNPTEELEAEIMEKFGVALDEFKSSGKTETSITDENKSKEFLDNLRETAERNNEKAKEALERTRAEAEEDEENIDEAEEDDEEEIEEPSDTEEPKKKPFPSMDDESEEESADVEKPGKKPFPTIDDSTSKKIIADLKSRINATEPAKKAEAPAKENPLEDDTANLDFKKFNKRESSSRPKAVPFFKRLIGAGKDIVESIKESFAEGRKKVANRYYFDEDESERESSGSLALGK